MPCGSNSLVCCTVPPRFYRRSLFTGFCSGVRVDSFQTFALNCCHTISQAAASPQAGGPRMPGAVKAVAVAGEAGPVGILGTACRRSAPASTVCADRNPVYHNCTRRGAGGARVGRWTLSIAFPLSDSSRGNGGALNAQRPSNTHVHVLI